MIRKRVLVGFVWHLRVVCCWTPCASSQKGRHHAHRNGIGVDGKPVANAAVSCESSGGLSPHATHTDFKGRFIITGLKQDSYDLRASANGANSDWQRNIPLRRGQTKDITLRFGQPSATPPAATPVKQTDAKPQP